MKSSTAAKVEHRLQVAFYVEMLSALFAVHDVSWDSMHMGVLYRGPADGDAGLSEQETAERNRQRAAAADMFGEAVGLLEITRDPEHYRGSVRELVTDPASVAAQVAEAEFEDVPFHLSYKCDGCLYNELCMKWSAERDDLSLLPYISAEEKGALRRAGIRTIGDLAHLKELRSESRNATNDHHSDLVAAHGKEKLVQQLGATWPVGPHLDELIYRARAYRKWKKEKIEARSYIPSKGYGSLPYSDAQQNANLVRVYIDAQHDYLQDRIYMLGALVVASEAGREPPGRRRSIVHLAEGPPESAEQEQQLFVSFVTELMRTLVELAAPDEEGRPRAPIHLIFFNHFEQRLLLDGLARHFESILAATPLYDFVTQLAAFDSPIATFLDREIRELKNYPMVCQSLQAVAAFLGFHWNEPAPYREIFRTRMFDFWGKFDAQPRPDETPWYTNRSRFNSQIPLEYAYAAWGQLPASRYQAAEPPAGKHDEFATYRGATTELVRGFHARRLEAMERVAKDFTGNKFTQKTSFELLDLATFDGLAQSLAQALDEFLIVERHVKLADWKARRLAPPERRVLAGDTLIVRYCEEDQDPGIAEQNRDNARRRALEEKYRADWLAGHPDAKKVLLPKDQREACRWSQEGMLFRLRLEMAGVDADLDEALGLTSLRERDSLVLFPRTTVDSRLPAAERVPFMPTPKQMLYGLHVDLARITVERDRGNRAVRAFVEVTVQGPRSVSNSRGFIFSTMRDHQRPLAQGQVYTLDGDPNDWYGYFCSIITEKLRDLEASSPGGNNTLYDRLTQGNSSSRSAALRGCVDPERETSAGATSRWFANNTAAGNGGDGAPTPSQPETAALRESSDDVRAAAQSRFLAGLEALQHAGAIHPFDEPQRAYIGGHGDAPTLLVHGPPGTGKSYCTAFALFARVQGALAAGLNYRVCVSARTHAATEVLLGHIVHVQGLLADMQASYAEIFARYFDERLLQIPLFRFASDKVPPGVIRLRRKDDREKGKPSALDSIRGAPHCVVAATPGGVYRILKDDAKDLFGNELFDCLVLDEASQMNLPEAVMAATPLKEDGRMIVVGDHRQMPPIVQHDWSREPRRTFQQFRSYESLFLALQPLDPPMIKLQESFRLHADMAAFLREEIYRHDGIPYFSRRDERLVPHDQPDPFVAAVLHPDHPIVVVTHDEAGSILRNAFEQGLITPVLEALAGEPYCLEPRHGLGVVVPHRAQRAALQEAIPQLNVMDPHTGAVALSAVDTVERFQGDERSAILVSATESDPAYLLLSSEFLLDPRRLTVALSRAKRKMMLVASQSVFSLFSADEETFENAQLWKSLLRKWCTVRLWEGERLGKAVTVWGNAPVNEEPTG
jgi:hypothetical protein